MRDKEYLEWERQLYERRKQTRNQRKRNRCELAWHISIVVWAVFIVILLAHRAFSMPQETRDIPVTESAPEPLKTAVVDVEPEEEKDWTKLPMIENATLTHYCICKKCCGKDESHPAYGVTASGREAEPYLSVAVDPILIPLGSTVYVDYGDGDIKEYRADDTGSSVSGAHLDLCVSFHEEALELGVKTVKVWYE